jgi:hypothetical protein
MIRARRDVEASVPGTEVLDSMKHRFSALVLTCVLVAATSLAGSPAAAQKGWEKDLGLYLWAISLDGIQVVQGTPVEVDSSFSDTLEDLDLAFIHHPFRSQEGPVDGPVRRELG